MRNLASFRIIVECPHQLIQVLLYRSVSVLFRAFYASLLQTNKGTVAGSWPNGSAQYPLFGSEAGRPTQTEWSFVFNSA